MKQKPDISCGWSLERFSLFYDHFAFVDTKDYLADGLFIKHKVPVVFGDEFARSDSSYLVIFCKCRKKYTNALMAALQELPNKMMICGFSDYPQFCEKLKADFEEAHKRMKGGKRHEQNSPVGETEQTEAERVS